MQFEVLVRGQEHQPHRATTELGDESEPIGDHITLSPELGVEPRGRAPRRVARPAGLDGGRSRSRTSSAYVGRRLAGCASLVNAPWSRAALGSSSKLAAAIGRLLRLSAVSRVKGRRGASSSTCIPREESSCPAREMSDKITAPRADQVELWTRRVAR